MSGFIVLADGRELRFEMPHRDQVPEYIKFIPFEETRLRFAIRHRIHRLNGVIDYEYHEVEPVMAKMTGAQVQGVHYNRGGDDSPPGRQVLPGQSQL